MSFATKRAQSGQETAEPGTTTAQPSKTALDRAARLTRLLPLWPHEAADLTYPGRLRLLAKLRRALRKERQKGLAGHWSYDLARHRKLLSEYRAEVASCLALPASLKRAAPTEEGDAAVRTQET
jgi:hypothetical protein